MVLQIPIPSMPTAQTAASNAQISSDVVSQGGDNQYGSNEISTTSNMLPIAQGSETMSDAQHRNYTDQGLSRTPVLSNLASGMYSNLRDNNNATISNNNFSGDTNQYRPPFSQINNAFLPNISTQNYFQLRNNLQQQKTQMSSQYNLPMMNSNNPTARVQSPGNFPNHPGRGPMSNYNQVGSGRGSFGGLISQRAVMISNNNVVINSLGNSLTSGANSSRNNNTARNSNSGRLMWGSGNVGFFGNNTNSRPPLQPMTPTVTRNLSSVDPSAALTKEQQRQTQTVHQRNKHVTNLDANDESAVTALEDGSLITASCDASMIYDASLDVALTTGLVTLSIHEALTFDGVELALHPDVFNTSHNQKSHKSNGKAKSADSSSGGKEDVAFGGKLRPGDLVEIRVWAARPGVSPRSTSPPKLKSSSGSKSKSKTGVGTSLHSRNPSLHTVSSSSLGVQSPAVTSGMGSVLYGTPLSLSGGNQIPPLPSVVGGDRSSPGSFPSGGSLYGETLVESIDENSGGLSQVSKENAGSISHISTAASSLLAGAASSLFRNLSASNQHSTNPAISSIPSLTPTQKLSFLSFPESGTFHVGDASTISHSRDSSFVTNSTAGALHSRESSLIMSSSSWLNALNNCASQDIQQSSPLTNNLDASHTTMDPVDESSTLSTQPVITNLSRHSFSTNAPGDVQVLSMRRDGLAKSSSAVATSSAGLPHHPLASAPNNTSGIPPLESGTSTPSSIPSSPKITPHSTPPASSKAGDLSTFPKTPSTTNVTNPSYPTSQSTNLPVRRGHNEKVSPTSLEHNANQTPRIQNRVENRNDKQQHTSTTEIPANNMTTHVRHHSTTASAESMANTSSCDHRRHTSSVPALSSTGPFLPPVVEAKDGIDQEDGTEASRRSSDTEKNEDNAVEDVLELLQRTHFVRVSFVMPVSEGSLKSIKSGARTQVSLLRRVADLYKITAYDTVTVTQIARRKQPYVRRSIAADFVTVTMKDQFVSRGDMHLFQKAFLNKWVYEGKRLSFDGIRTNAKVIRHGDHAIRSGIISDDTIMTFRSRSARIIWLVQLSSEMWDFASPYEAASNQKDHEASCHIYFDKFISFARRLFEKWKKLELTHNLTVVFFSRTYIRVPGIEKEDLFNPNSSFRTTPSAVRKDHDGRMFEDHYKIVIENETRPDWVSLVYRMKKEFVKYPMEVSWDLTPGNERIPSTATQGNILEAINITLNLLHLHYIDRDLHRTGNSIVIITAGNGVFEIEKNLAGITKQRMMDNGIGSDMLSLGLPPLHVAPFFLYKEQSSSSAEEIQGFDDWKTYFEVPHWMNLSFVRYDSTEEPMLYKDQHLNIEEKQEAQNDSEDIAHLWNASNGFMSRKTASINYSTKAEVTHAGSEGSQYKHLISDRKFEDILQACRPRSRGEYGSGLPTPLSSLLIKIYTNPSKLVDNSAGYHHNQPWKDANSHVPRSATSTENAGMNSPHRALHSSHMRYLEWGAVNFDDITKKWQNSHQGMASVIYATSNSGSLASPSSSFGSLGSFKRSPHSLGHLQSSMSLEKTGHSLSSGGDTHAAINRANYSDESMTSMSTDMKPDPYDKYTTKHGKGNGFDPQNCPTLSSIEKYMREHDKNAFSHPSKRKDIVSTTVHNVMKSSLENDRVSSLNSSFRPGSPTKLDDKGALRSHSSLFPLRNKGGIEAALSQYDVNVQVKERDSVGLSSRVNAITENVVILPEENTGRSFSISPLSVGIGMPYSLDRRSDAIRPGFMRLVAPEAIPRATPNKLRLSHDSRQIKHLGHPSKDNKKIGDRHSSINHTSQQHLSESSAKTKLVTQQQGKMKKHHSQARKYISYHHHSNHHNNTQRHRRKHWVLNPFRQEDEDEVLAKRTHNRRRWSHVFPLGEAEFKRHAGPNWKSLCQPAILPITIDFHPSPQELQDRDKYRVKQYSVTLPSMDETHYTSHTELLDELVLQRLIQDYQIVPWDIIQQNGRRSDAAENILQHTLSMGHKIQRLSYNPSQDSVDVVQYYANFAENENPQTCRYYLWSALRQDYVSVSQTFTKYTSPYKWNEVDMLISGDAVTSIVEGMRFPRISFVIIPDQFTNEKEESDYSTKFQRLLEYFAKMQPKRESNKIEVQIYTSSSKSPQDSATDKKFVVDLRKRNTEKYEWMELVHDSNCDTRRTFRITIQWLVAVAGKIEQQAQLLQRRCTQYGLKLVSVPHFSCLRSVTMNPFAVPIFIPVRNEDCVNNIEGAMTTEFDFVYDGNHMSDPNEIDCIDGFDFVVNKWSIKKRKKFVPARQYFHRSGTLFARFVRDARGCAIVILYLNQRHNGGDEQLLDTARSVFNNVEEFIVNECERVKC
mmetsp:Transcript_8359/g.17809  ORF Transcript_8359/g.17809 Transcript_8359/m.17809 type:complete len:2336 (+) Transcript_8359:221-7228(+)